MIQGKVMAVVFYPVISAISNPGFEPVGMPAFDGGGFNPLTISDCQMWLDFGRLPNMVTSYDTLVAVVSGTAGTTTLTANVDPASIEVEQQIRVGGSDIYFVTNVSGMVITVDRDLMQTYSGASLEIAEIDSISDLSGNGNDATQTVDGSRFQLRKDSIGFYAYAGVNAATNMNINNMSFDWNANDFCCVAIADLDSGATGFRGVLGVRFGAGAGTGWWTLGTATTTSDRMAMEIGPAATVELVDDTLVPNGTGTHIFAACHDVANNIAAIYRDGVQRDTGDASNNNLGGPTNNFVIGRWFSSGQQWQGRIRELMFYSKNLSQTEQTKLANYAFSRYRFQP